MTTMRAMMLMPPMVLDARADLRINVAAQMKPYDSACEYYVES